MLQGFQETAMPPRKSIGRPTSATPARSTRASTAATGESPPSKRHPQKAPSLASTRSRRTRLNDGSPPGGRHLPDVQTQQSYAYGANKGPVLPETLATDDKYSIAAMAGHIEDAVDEEEGSMEVAKEDRQDEEDEDEAPVDDSQLSDIPEDDSSSEAAERSSLPSNMPSDLPDQSYNYERGIRRIRPTLVRTHAPQPFSPVKQIRQSTGEAASRVATSISKVAGELSDFIHTVAFACRSGIADSTQAVLHTSHSVPVSAIGSVLVLMLGVILAVGLLGTTTCFLYSRIGCSLIPTDGFGQTVHVGFQTICGDCQATVAPVDLSNISSGDISRISSTLENINKKIQDLERRLSYRIDSKYASLESDLANLKQQQTALSNHLADHVDSQSGPSGDNVASPLIPKINFFAPSNGAVVDPLRSSPTKAKMDNLFKRVARRAVGIAKHDVNLPTTALKAWHDIGDCWCASNAAPGSDFVRLAIDTKEMVYPTELVIEHFPASGNLERNSTPRKVELWADFAHFSKEEWQQLQLNDMQEGNVLGSTFARIGSMRYDAAGRANHVQSGILNVNQYGMLHYAKSFVLRVTGNYGGSNVCLYRVRLHGQHIAAPEVGAADEWYEQQGYAVDD